MTITQFIALTPERRDLYVERTIAGFRMLQRGLYRHTEAETSEERAAIVARLRIIFIDVQAIEDDFV